MNLSNSYRVVYLNILYEWQRKEYTKLHFTVKKKQLTNTHTYVNKSIKTSSSIFFVRVESEMRFQSLTLYSISNTENKENIANNADVASSLYLPASHILVSNPGIPTYDTKSTLQLYFIVLHTILHRQILRENKLI